MSELPSSFHRVQSRRIFEEVSDQFCAQIASGALKIGDKLPAERELAVQLGVSRAALREALRGLEFSGLIGLQKGVKGGSFVLGGEMGLVNSFENMFAIGRVSLAELFEARIEIQDVIVRLAVSNHNAADIRALEQDIRNTQKIIDLNMVINDPFPTQQFYTLLAKATRNRVLIVVAQALSLMVYQAILPAGRVLNFDIVDVRNRFLHAIKEHDVESARIIMRDYLRFLHHHIVSTQASSKSAKARIPQPASRT